MTTLDSEEGEDRVQLNAVLMDEWKRFRSSNTPFTIPGHKGRGRVLSRDLGELLSSDVPLYGGLDTVKLSHGHLAAAEERAARLWSADWARFSTGGSTHGNQAALMAVAQLPGDGVLIGRNAHRSTLSGLILTGLTPTWLAVDVDPVFGMPAGVSSETLLAALRRGTRPKALLLTEPAYLGVLSDLETLVGLAHEHDVPVVVDQAWGAHLGFHPEYPPHALTQGADLMVCSAHKTLPAYSQACLVVAHTERFPRDVLDRAFELCHTTSPAGSILASVDAARAVLEQNGEPLLEVMRQHVVVARARLSRIPGIDLPGPEDFPARRFDPAKLVIKLHRAGLNGVTVERELIARGMPIEMADRDTLVPIVTMVDDGATLGALCHAIEVAVGRLPREQPRAVGYSGLDGVPTQVMTPRDAFLAGRDSVPWQDAVGRVCAEIVAPYPPGVAELVPGELITRDVVSGLRQLAASGTRIAYAADPGLAMIEVVRDA